MYDSDPVPFFQSPGQVNPRDKKYVVRPTCSAPFKAHFCCFLSSYTHNNIYQFFRLELLLLLPSYPSNTSIHSCAVRRCFFFTRIYTINSMIYRIFRDPCVVTRDISISNRFLPLIVIARLTLGVSYHKSDRSESDDRLYVCISINHSIDQLSSALLHLADDLSDFSLLAL